MAETIVGEQKISLDYSEMVIDKINERGWNVYDVSGSVLGSLEFIRTGPAMRLEEGKNYALFPVVEDPKDSAQVALAFTAIVKRLDWNMPTMETSIARIGAKFSCGKDKIYPRLPGGGWTETNPLTYLRSLETLPALTSPKVQQDIKNAIRKV